MVIAGINSSGIIGQILDSGTQSITGDMALTFFLIIFLLFVVAISFGIPLEFFEIIIIPLALVMSAFQGSVMLILVVIFLSLGWLLTRNFLFR